MRIANYLRPDCVALRQRADSLTGAVQQMVTLLDGTDNLTDTAVFAADVRARLALGGVCVGNGLAIPHAKSTAVRQLQLAALTLDPPLPCDTPDGKPLDLLVMIAAPAEANDLHVQVLAELATLFLDTDFCARLRESETPDAFCRAISAREEQAAQEPPSAPSDAAPGAAKSGYQLLAVTACPTGIAHTYLAAEALQQAAQARGLTLKVETNGAAGVNDELTDDEIQAAECVIVAVDCSIPLARFVGKRLVYASAGDAVRDADRLLEKAVSGKAPVYRGGHAFRASEWKELGREYYGHLMSGISHMLPFVVAGGVMLALSLLLQHLFGRFFALFAHQQVAQRVYLVLRVAFYLLDEILPDGSFPAAGAAQGAQGLNILPQLFVFHVKSPPLPPAPSAGRYSPRPQGQWSRPRYACSAAGWKAAPF